MFQQLLPLNFFWQALAQAQVRENNRFYHCGVVMWLMIVQRLQRQGTMESAVVELLAELPGSFWPHPCKRVAEALRAEGARVSKHTAAYNKARQALPLSIVENSYDHVVQQLMAEVVPSRAQRPAFFFDGTTVRMPHCAELLEAYPPTGNQHGESHWPLLRLLVAHDLESGLALRPVWGAVNGREAVSEQRLLERTIDGLPEQAMVVGDANFGVFSVAYAAQRRGRPVLLRLTTARAQRLAAGALADGIDRRIEWKPTREDRRTHPELPADASVFGRLIVRRVYPSNGAKPFLLALFTSVEDPATEVVELYGKRWTIEVDLRTLKSTLALEELTCTSTAMVAKEIDVAMLAYNLVRAVMWLMAQKTGLEPRAFSFTQVKNVLQAFVPRMAAAANDYAVRKAYDDMLYYLGQCKLRRRQRRSYPRAVWPKPKAYPARHVETV